MEFMQEQKIFAVERRFGIEVPYMHWI